MMQSWNGLATVEAILLDHNALTGFLPSTWGDLEQLELLSLGMAFATLCKAAVTTAYESIPIPAPSSSSKHAGFIAVLISALLLGAVL